VNLVGFTPHPDQEWMEQQARNLTMEEWGCLRGCRYLPHDRDAKFCQSFRELIKTGSVNPLGLPAIKKPEFELVRGTLGEVGQRRMSVEADLVWGIVAAASVAAINRTLPRGAQPSGQRQSDLVSFAAGGKEEHGSSAASRTTGRPAEILREGSSIKVDGTADDGLTITCITIRMPGISPGKRPPAPDLSSTGAEQ